MTDVVMAARDRSALRRRVRIHCQVVEEEGFTLVARECVDLSFGGMAVKMLRPVAVGTALIVSFRVPGSSFVCDFEAQVVRLVAGRRRRDRFTGFGLRFVSVDPLSRAMLSARLRGLPPPLPTRRQRMDYAASVRAVAA